MLSMAFFLMVPERGKTFIAWANAVEQENSEYPWTRVMRVQVPGFNLDVPELQLLICQNRIIKVARVVG